MSRPDLVVLGGSWGGLRAAVQLLRAIPVPLPVPVLLVLHRSRDSAREVVERVLVRDGGHPAREIGDKDSLTPGTVHLAPADYHVLVEGGSVSLSVEDPVNHSRPSIDLAFDSAAEDHGDGVVAVLLSGLGEDGVRGLAAVRRRGGAAWVQDPAGAEKPELPRAAISAGVADTVDTPERLGAMLADLLGRAGR